MRAWALGVSAALALSACEQREAPPAEAKAPAPAAGTLAAIPLSFGEAGNGVETKLTLPAALAKHPGLHRVLYDREVAALRAFAADARRSRTEFGADMPPFASEVTWRVSAETPRLLSLVRETYEFQGGAHPNTALSTLIFDKQAGREIEGEALVAADELTRLDDVLCDAVRAEKAKKGGVEIDGDTWACPTWKDAQLALSAGGGKAAGVTAMISPYEVGPYAEGAYQVTVPTSAFSAALSEEYRGEFAG